MHFKKRRIIPFTYYNFEYYLRYGSVKFIMTLYFSLKFTTLAVWHRKLVSQILIYSSEYAFVLNSSLEASQLLIVYYTVLFIL
jgi:hypothetical protein